MISLMQETFVDVLLQVGVDMVFDLINIEVIVELFDISIIWLSNKHSFLCLIKHYSSKGHVPSYRRIVFQE